MKKDTKSDNKSKSNELQAFSNFVVFKTAQGKVNIEVFFYKETIWLTQKKIAELFEKSRSTITEHLTHIFSDGELDENSVCRDFRHTAEDGKTYTSKFYNLQAKLKAESEFGKYRPIQDRLFESDFDKEIKKLIGKKDKE